MSLLALTHNAARLRVRGGALEVEESGVVTHTLQPHLLREVHLYGGADLSQDARNLCLREDIDVVFLTADGRVRGRLVGPASRWGERRLAQLAATLDPARRLALARSFVQGKVHNQRVVLLARQQHLRLEALADCLAALRGSLRTVERAETLDALRGAEGLAARWYFGGLSQALTAPGIVFNGRNRQPPRDPFNAALSFGYALLQARAERAVLTAGLDLHVGLLHEATQGAPALALDLMEELRPAVDRLVLTLFNRRQLAEDDFREPLEDELEGVLLPPGERAVYLADTGRTILLRAWEAELDRPALHPTREDRWPLRELLLQQAQQLTRVLMGEAPAYRPIDLGV